MTMWEFLAQAGFWQWLGLITLAGAIASGLNGLVTIVTKPRRQ